MVPKFGFAEALNFWRKENVTLRQLYLDSPEPTQPQFFSSDILQKKKRREDFFVLRLFAEH